jgi:hypothetical protein
VALASATLGSAEGGSVSLRRRGRVAAVAWADQNLLDMDADAAVQLADPVPG